MKKSLLIINLLFISLSAFSQSVSKTMLRLPDTGETTSYTATFGEDNDYNLNTPYFIINNDGTVTDTITGLIWQQGDGGEMSIDNAIKYCDSLTLGGYTDWKLPNAHEAFSILNHQKSNPALDIKVFTKTTAEYWWTADNQYNDNTKTWATNAGGGIGNHPKNETISSGGNKKFHARAVRYTKTPEVVANHFTDNGDGTIKDNLTNLIWQKVPSTNLFTWEDALMYAENLTSAGYSDWRMPNIKELQSINDEKISNPSINITYFNQIGIKKYWSSTTLPNQTTKAWYLDSQFGITTYDLKTNSNYLICVRGNLANTSTSIKENILKNSQIKIHPNPASSFINIQTDRETSSNIKSVKLINAIGLTVFEKTDSFNHVDLKIDLSSFSNGIYYISINENQSWKTYKLIISR